MDNEIQLLRGQVKRLQERIAWDELQEESRLVGGEARVDGASRDDPGADYGVLDHIAYELGWDEMDEYLTLQRVAQLGYALACVVTDGVDHAAGALALAQQVRGCVASLPPTSAVHHALGARESDSNAHGTP